jgi:hypothetical protein
MKSALVAVFLFFASAAFGQNMASVGAMSSQPYIFEMPSHPLKATEKPLKTAESLLESSASTYAQGERPLWEFAPQTNPQPLGDVARALKKEHALDKKSEVTWEN